MRTSKIKVPLKPKPFFNFWLENECAFKSRQAVFLLSVPHWKISLSHLERVSPSKVREISCHQNHCPHWKSSLTSCCSDNILDIPSLSCPSENVYQEKKMHRITNSGEFTAQLSISLFLQHFKCWWLGYYKGPIQVPFSENKLHFF